MGPGRKPVGRPSKVNSGTSLRDVLSDQSWRRPRGRLPMAVEGPAFSIDFLDCALRSHSPACPSPARTSTLGRRPAHRLRPRLRWLRVGSEAGTSTPQCGEDDHRLRRRLVRFRLRLSAASMLGPCLQWSIAGLVVAGGWKPAATVTVHGHDRPLRVPSPTIVSRRGDGCSRRGQRRPPRAAHAQFCRSGLRIGVASGPPRTVVADVVIGPA
jgi:hypothetical protein